MSRFRLLRHGRPPVVYDTSVGAGMTGASANLPLNTAGGARRFFVNSVGGSNSFTATESTDPAKPLATIAKGVSYMTSLKGDQVLVAENSSYSEKIPNLGLLFGASRMFPTTVQSYDPLDPLNESKYGRSFGTKRPVVTGTGVHSIAFGIGGGQIRNLALRGFDFNPGNIAGNMIKLNDMGGGFLLENLICRFMDTEWDTGGSPIGALDGIIRGCAIYGGFDVPANHMQNIYLHGINYTIEENFLWAAGMQVPIDRDASTGGGDQFKHGLYIQNGSNGTVRRNLIMDPSATAAQCRGDTDAYGNIIIDAPIAFSLGGGTNYHDTSPADGVNLQCHHNFTFGDADINSVIPDGQRGWGISSAGGKIGSSSHHNGFARGNPARPNKQLFVTGVDYSDRTSYMDFHDNSTYQWANAGRTHFTSSGGFPANLHDTYENNYWGELTGGGNFNESLLTGPNRMTALEYYALKTGIPGCTKQQFIDYNIANVEQCVWQNDAAMLNAAYGFPQ